MTEKFSPVGSPATLKQKLSARVVTKKKEAPADAPTLEYDPESLLITLLAPAKTAKPGKEPKTLMSIYQPRVVNLQLPNTQSDAEQLQQGPPVDDDGQSVPVGCFGGKVSPADASYTTFTGEKEGGNSSGSAAARPPAEQTSLAEYTLTFMPTKETDPKHLCDIRFAAVAGEEEQLKALFEHLEMLTYPEGPKKVIAFVSPASGSGKGEKLWAQYGVPILSRTRHTLVSHITQKRNWAMEWVADPSNALSSNDVVVAVGGDGIVFEVVNGLKQRLTNMGQSTEGGTASVLPAVGLFPCGSGCAIATGLDVLKYTNAVLALVQTSSVTLDCMKVSQAPTAVITKKKESGSKDDAEEEIEPVPVDSDAKPLWSLLSLTTAFVAEIDKCSEKWRWMGNARFTAYAMRRLMSGVPSYRATIKYLPWVPPQSPAAVGMPDWGPDGAATPKKLIGPGHRCRLTEDCPCFSLHSPASTTAASPAADTKGQEPEKEEEEETAAAAPPKKDADEKEEDWIEIKDHNFCLVTICRYAYLARDSVICPFSHAADGAIDLSWVKDNATRTTLIKGLINMETATHIEAMPDDFFYVKARKVLVEPSDGYVMVDGEHVDLHGYLMEMDRQAVRLIRYKVVDGHQWPK